MTQTQSPSATADQPDRRGAFRLLCASLVCVGLGQSLLFSLLPPLARIMEMPEWTVGAVFALSGALWVVMSPFWGRKSDRWGRKRVILMGVTTYGVSTVLFIAAVEANLAALLSVWAAVLLMMLARGLFGLVGSGSFPAAQAYIADRTTPAERTRHITGIHSAFMIGLVLGPALGGLLVGISILAPLYVVAVVAFASAIALALFLPERRPPQDRAVMPRLKLSDPRLVPFVIASMAMSTCHASTMQTIGFYMIDTLDLDPATAAFHIGISLTAMALATLFVQLVGIRLLDPSPRQLMRWGTGVALMAFPVLLTTQSEVQTLGGMVLLGAGLGMLRPSIGTAASLAVKPGEQGAAAGLVMGAGSTGHVISSLAIMPFYQFFHAGPYILNAMLMAGLLIYTLTNRRIRAAVAR